MTKKQIDPYDYAGDIARALLSGGVLLTTKANGTTDTMTIGWGAVGNEWGVPMFTAFVRTGRYTTGLLEANPQFTISAPMEGSDKKILGFCGSHSRRTTDKIAELGLTLVEPEAVSAPAIAEMPLTLECQVVYKQPQVISAMEPEFQQRFYPQDVPSTSTGSNKDAHVAYYGKIVAAYICE